MTTSQQIPAIRRDPARSAELTPTTPSPTSVLITEPEVAFGTAAAGALRSSTTRWWNTAARVAGAVVYRLFLAPTPRRAYLDDGVMAREMYRL